MHVFDVGSDNKLSNQKLFTDFMIDGVKCGPDGVRADVDGKPLGVEQRVPGTRLQRRDGVEPGGQAHRADPAAGDVRQHLLRAAPSATGSSWQPASRCTRSTRPRRARHRVRGEITAGPHDRERISHATDAWSLPHRHAARPGGTADGGADRRAAARAGWDADLRDGRPIPTASTRRTPSPTRASR